MEYSPRGGGGGIAGGAMKEDGLPEGPKEQQKKYNVVVYIFVTITVVLHHASQRQVTGDFFNVEKRWFCQISKHHNLIIINLEWLYLRVR